MKRTRPVWFLRLSLKGAVLIAIALIVAIQSSCAPLSQELRLEEPEISDAHRSPFVSIMEVGDEQYVPLAELLEQAEYRLVKDESNRQLSFGDTDIVYELRAGEQTVGSEGEVRVHLEEAPEWREGQIWLSPRSIAALLGDEVRFRVENNHLILEPSAEPLRPFDENVELSGDTGTIPDFAEAADEADDGSGTEARTPRAAAANVEIDALIREARKYIGVRYEFGADPYPESGTFDCSSFIRYVYGKFGINLPRVSRNQAARGTAVSRSNLKRGDLLFFYVPGRFRTNETVGHVGIYIGNGQMIHSSPEPKNGVQITDINRDYWKRTFLQARRVIS